MASQLTNKVRVALCQLLVGADKAKNLQNATTMVEKAAGSGAKVVMLPECFNSPYSTACFADYAEDIPTVNSVIDETKNPSSYVISKLAKKHNIWLIGGSIPEKWGTHIFNTSIVFNPQGSLVASHRKMHLFDIDVPGKICFKESDVLSPGHNVTTFDTEYGKFGLGICYDLRFPLYAQIAVDAGARLMLYPGAFNTTTGPAHWELLLRARALDNQVFVCAASPARSPDLKQYQAWGHSSVVNPWGSVIATTDHDQDLVVADIDFEEVETIRGQIPIRTQRRDDVYQLNHVQL
mmetsp:Transcript_16039/g.22557  ORF Transcript_16039/g.22557 Transcript_16039/m.22557 type:complete len:293 (-) Transcript_16039:141-1019(-)